MRKGRNPNRAEKKVLARAKKDWSEWLVLENTPSTEKRGCNVLVFKNKNNDEVFGTVARL